MTVDPRYMAAMDQFYRIHDEAFRERFQTVTVHREHFHFRQPCEVLLLDAYTQEDLPNLELEFGSGVYTGLRHPLRFYWLDLLHHDQSVNGREYLTHTFQQAHYLYQQRLFHNPLPTRYEQRGLDETCFLNWVNLHARMARGGFMPALDLSNLTHGQVVLLPHGKKALPEQGDVCSTLPGNCGAAKRASNHEDIT